MSDDDEDDRPKITFVSKKDRLKRDGKVDVKSEKIEKGNFKLYSNKNLLTHTNPKYKAI